MSQPNQTAEYMDEKKEICDKFIKDYGAEGEEALTQVDDWKEFIEDVRSCDHICSGNCRRVGCNCNCGEWHMERIDKYDPVAVNVLTEKN